MAMAKDINVKSYCDTVNNELMGIKKRIDAMRDELVRTFGEKSDITDVHKRHLCELSDYVDWKLQILEKVCPFDWKGMGEDVESTVSVSQADRAPDPDFSGGYIGG